VITWDQWWERKNKTNLDLVAAIESNNVKSVSDLLNESKQPHGLIANVNMRVEQNNETPLHRAVVRNNLEIVKILVRLFAEINAQNAQGKTALHIASTNGNL